MSEMYRQGDVLLIKINKEDLPDKRVTAKNNILAYGEVTGHKHEMFNATVTEMQDAKFVEVDSSSAVLKHEEHEHIQLPKGVYKVVLQQEYTPSGPINVMD